MIRIKQQTDWYNSKARALNEHVKGMRATILIPVLKEKIERNEVKIKAFGRHRLLRQEKHAEETFLTLNAIMLGIATRIATFYRHG